MHTHHTRLRTLLNLLLILSLLLPGGVASARTTPPGPAQAEQSQEPVETATPVPSETPVIHSPSPTLTVTYQYDAYVTGSNYGRGLRTGMSDASGSASWKYDTRGRLTEELKTISGSGSFKTQWGYNAADQVTWMKYPGGNASQVGEQVSYTYHTQGALDSVTAGSTTYVRRTIYDASGRVELRELGWNGSSPILKVDYDYFAWDTPNGQGPLKQIKAGTTADATSLLDLRYFSGTNSPAYDAVGNLLNIYDYKMGSPQTQSFTYDNLDRLTSASASGGTGGIYSESYTYNNDTGNLASKGGLSYTYGEQSASCPDGSLSKPHAVVTAGSNAYCYDQNGNQVKRTIGGSTNTLSYDAENHLIGVSGAATATFVYDGDGVRVKGTVNGVTTVYVGEILEWTGSTSSMVKYYYAGSNRVAMRVGSNNPKWLLSDHLGSQSVVASYNGLTKEGELRYKAWGAIRYTSGTTPTKRQYTGQVNEDLIKLYWIGSRWYDPALGRWIQPDSIVPEAAQGVQAWDRYAYSNNSPVHWT